MEYPSWQTAKQQVTYSRRSPEQSQLYRVVYHYREQFEYSWDELFSERYGVLREEVLEAFDKYLNCGIVRHGCALACCENCSHSQLIAFSCKRRGVCPSCQAKRAVLFAEHLHENILLPHDHRHLIFSIPKRLRIYFRFDRKLFGALYRAAWETWSEYVEALIPGGKPGAVMALHTAGTMLEWNPHLHTIALNGAIGEDGSFEKLPVVDQELIQEFFSEKVFDFLLKTELIDQNTVESMRSWKHSGFHFYAGEAIQADDADARLFLARYLKKPPLSARRLSVDESQKNPVVNYRHPELDESGEQIVRSFSPLEFLAELSVHIPKIFEQTTRFFGEYSPRRRGVKRREEEFKKLVQNNFEPLEYEPPKRPPSASWARCMKMVFEVDPLECPKCGSRMSIKSFVTSSQEIEKLCNYVGIRSWRAPPKFKKLPDAVWLDDSQEFSQVH